LLQIRLGDLQAAQTAIENAFARIENPPANYFIRAGQIQEMMGNTDLALAFYQDALALDPMNETLSAWIARLSDE
jgi:tetratricopeptide (TPR) repeat protein